MCRTHRNYQSETPTGYFLRLTNDRQPDGRRDFIRRADGRRAVLNAGEAIVVMQGELAKGNLTAQIRPVYDLRPDSDNVVAGPTAPVPAGWDAVPGGLDVPVNYDQNGPTIADAEAVFTAEEEALYQAALVKAPADLTDVDRAILARG